MKKVTLSEKAHAWLSLLLKDETIRNAMMMDQEVARRITILDDGSVRLEKHKCKLLNWLFNEGRTIPFIEVCGIIADILSGHPSNRNEDTLNGLSQTLVDNILNQHDDTSESMIDTLFTVYMHGFNGKYSTSFTRDVQENSRAMGSTIIPIVPDSGNNGTVIRVLTDDPNRPFVFFSVKDLYMRFKESYR